MADTAYWKEHSFFRILPKNYESFELKEDLFYDLNFTGGYDITSLEYDESVETWFVTLDYQGMQYYAEVFWEDWDWAACYELEKDIFPDELRDQIVKGTKTLTVSMGILGTYAVHGYWLQLQFAHDLVTEMLCLYDESKEHLHTPDWVGKAVAAQRKFPLNHLFTIHMEVEDEKQETHLTTSGLARFGIDDIEKNVDVVPSATNENGEIERIKEHIDQIIDQASESLLHQVNAGAFSRMIHPDKLKHIH